MYISKKRNGFTLIELLVVITIISLLMSILMPGLNKARKLARQVKASCNARQLLMAYDMYSSDNKDMLLWGYPPMTLHGRPVIVNDKVSGHTYTYPVSSRYPWHIASYVDNIWDVVYSHMPIPEVPSINDSDSEAYSKAYSLSVTPTFGLNSIYLGGHSHAFYKGFISSGGTFKENFGSHVVYRAGKIKRPVRQLVFVETAMASASEDISKSGYHTASPPHANGELWNSTNNEIVRVDTYRNLGLPIGRYSNKAVTGFYDQHVTVLEPDKLDDMTIWANKGTGKDYDF